MRKSERRKAILRIKYPVEKGFIQVAYIAQKKNLDGNFIMIKKTYGPGDYDFCDELGSFGFPSNWVKEIKPMNPEEYLHGIEPQGVSTSSDYLYTSSQIIKAYEAGAENEKLKQEPEIND